MDDRLRRAIALIQSGDKTSGARLLAEVLQDDPGNEIAWLWMSGVVETDEQRIDCLEHVLKTNPDNQAARQGLAVLRAKKEGLPETPPVSPEPSLPPTEALTEVEEMPAPVAAEVTAPVAEEEAEPPLPGVPPELGKRIWLNPGGQVNRVVALYDDVVVASNPDDEALKQLESKPETELPPRGMLGDEVAVVPLDSINLVTTNQRTSYISLRYRKNSRMAVETIYFVDSKDRDWFFGALEARLGEDFQRSVRQFNLLQAMLVPVVALAAIVAATLLCHGAAQEIVAGAESPITGGQRVLLRLLFSSLLSLIGPAGVLIIGVLLVLVILAWAASRIMRPPILMMLAPAGQQPPGIITPKPAVAPEAPPAPAPREEAAPLAEEEERAPLLPVRALLLLAILAVLLLAAAAFASRFLVNRPPL